MEFKTNIRHGAAIKQLVTLELIDAAGGATPLDTELAYDPPRPVRGVGHVQHHRR